MTGRSCVTNSSYFCFVCGEYMVGKKGHAISESLKYAYLHYFGFSIRNLDKPWTPRMFCNSCRTVLYKWSNGEKIYFNFSIPVLWRESTNHQTDCYFCLTKVAGFNMKNRKNIIYANVPSVSKPVQRSPNDPLPVIPSATTSESDLSFTSSCSLYEADEPHLVTQAELNDLIRDIHLTKQDSELLASRMQQWKHLAVGTKVTIYRYRSLEFAAYFEKKHSILYCTDVDGLFQKMKQPYDKTEWRLFIDGSKYSLKALLLHNGNKKPSIPIAHAINTKENYESMTEILTLLKYNDHKWKICGDLKVCDLNFFVCIV